MSLATACRPTARLGERGELWATDGRDKIGGRGHRRLRLGEEMPTLSLTFAHVAA